MKHGFTANAFYNHLTVETPFTVKHVLYFKFKLTKLIELSIILIVQVLIVQ